MRRIRMKRIAGLFLAALAVSGVLWAEGVLSINGAGATFPYPMYSKWFDEYHKKNANLQINYQSIGSGGGIKQVTEGTVDFGATDGPITDDNKGVKLPADDIVVVHRAEGSGTTYCWTDYLSKVSDEWKTKVGKGGSVNWPVGLGGKGSEGVTGTVKNTPNSIGYVELTYAESNKIPYGNVKNASGVFVKASLG